MRTFYFVVNANFTSNCGQTHTQNYLIIWNWSKRPVILLLFVTAMNDVEKPSVPHWQYGSLRGRKNCQCQLVGRPDGLTAVHKSVCARARISIQYFYPFASLQNKARHYPIASCRFVFSAKITSLELIWSQLPALPWTVLQKMMSYPISWERFPMLSLPIRESMQVYQRVDGV